MDPIDNQPSSEDDAVLSPTASTRKRKVRGSTILPNVTKDKSLGVRKVIKYNGKGQPIGKNKAKYMSYHGVLARTMIPIAYKSWFKVPSELKDKVWSCVELAFVVDPKSKKKVLSSISTKWKTFKRTLTRHIYANRSNCDLISKPPANYSYVEQKHWESFVKDRLSEEFEELRKVQQDRRSCSKYPHRISRKGYAQLEEELKLTLESPEEDLDRSYLWKKARQNKDGDYDNEEIMKQAARIDELTKHTKDGTLTSEGSNDILTMALGTPEHSGRVRGVGDFITPSTYFRLPRRGNHSRCEEKYNALEAALLHLQTQLNAMTQHTPRAPQSEDGSNTFRSENMGSLLLDPIAMEKGLRTNDGRPIMENGLRTRDVVPTTENGLKAKDGMPPPDPKHNVKKGKPCKLAVGNRDNIVAHGTMYERDGRNEVIHAVPLNEDDVRVSIDVVIVKDAVLPVPILGEATIVGEAMGYHVAWPKNLVLVGDEGAPTRTVAAPKNKRRVGIQRASKHRGMAGDKATSKYVEWEKNMESIQSFASYVETLDYKEAITILLEKDIFGDEISAHLQRVDMESICHMKEVSVTCIMLFMSHLYQVLKASNMEKSFLFMNPYIISGKSTSKPALLASRLKAAKADQFILVPYNVGYHWVLLVINLSSQTVYYVDSLRSEIDLTLEIQIITALKFFEATKGNRRSRPIWKVLECPKQPTNVECGFYVMKYMKDLINDRNILSKQNFNGKRTYTKAEIDEVRVEWINFIIKSMRSSLT